MSGKHFVVIVLLLSIRPLLAEEPRLDRHGDPLPPGAKVRLGTLRFRPGSLKVRVVLSPDGKTLTTLEDGLVRFWDLESGRETRTGLIGSGVATALSFSHDGLRFAALLDHHHQPYSTPPVDERSLVVGTVASGTILFRHHDKKGYFSLPTFSLDSTLDAFQAKEPDGNTLQLTMFDAATGAVRFEPGASTCHAFSPDGKLLATGQQDGTVILWDFATRQEVRQFGEGSLPVSVLCFSPDGRMVAVGRSDPKGVAAGTPPCPVQSLRESSGNPS